MLPLGCIDAASVGGKGGLLTACVPPAIPTPSPSPSPMPWVNKSVSFSYFSNYPGGCSGAPIANVLWCPGQCISAAETPWSVYFYSSTSSLKLVNCSNGLLITFEFYMNALDCTGPSFLTNFTTGCAPFNNPNNTNATLISSACSAPFPSPSRSPSPPRASVSFYAPGDVTCLHAPIARSIISNCSPVVVGQSVLYYGVLSCSGSLTGSSTLRLFTNSSCSNAGAVLVNMSRACTSTWDSSYTFTCLPGEEGEEESWESEAMAAPGVYTTTSSGASAGLGDAGAGALGASAFVAGALVCGVLSVWLAARRARALRAHVTVSPLA